MEQLSAFIKFIGCAGVTLVAIILIPFGVSICIENDDEFLGRTLTFFWVVEWIFATVFVYNAVFG